MNDILIKVFMKGGRDPKDPKVREAYGRLASWVGIAANALLCALKIGTGLIFGSISILADGINNLSDASASLMTLIGFKLAGKKPDKDHPYGHGRTEYLTGLAVSIMIVVIGVSLLRTSVSKTLHPEPMEFSAVSAAVLVLAIAVKIWLASFGKHIGEIIDSDTLKASATDARNDVISTSAVLVCLLIFRFTGLDLDGPVGILVAIFIIRSGAQLVMETVSPILGKAPDPGLVKEMTEEIERHEGVLGIHDMIIHDYGPGRMFASVHVEVDSSADLMTSHDMMDIIERDVYDRMGILLTVHMDPLALNDEVTALARERIEEVCKGLEYILGYHDVRTVAGPTHTNVIFDVVVDHECSLSPAEVREVITKGLKAFDPSYETVISIDRAYA